MVASSVLARGKDQTDSFGCSLGKLDDDRHLKGSGIQFYRKASIAGSPGQVSMPAADKGYLIGVALQGGHRRKVFNENHSSVYDFNENSIYVRDCAEDYKADLTGAFSFILLEVSRAVLGEFADGADAKKVTALDRVFAEPDPALAGLARALFSSMEGPFPPSALFVDQLSLAMGLHLVHAYGNGNASVSDRRRTLSRRNETLAKDLIESRLAGDLTVAELASACNLSRGMFARAFRETTGKTPHQWLTYQRLQRAQTLLMTSQLSLAEISTACGFADHSHFSRVFSVAFGTSPWAWRRTRLS